MRQRGQAAIQTIGLLLITLMMGGTMVDIGLYYTAHSGEQNAADASALAATAELFMNTSTDLGTREASARTAAKTISQLNLNNQLNDADIEFGYVDPIALNYDASTFTTPTTNTAFAPTSGYNAVRTTIKAASGEANQPIQTVFAKVLGFNTINSQARAVAVYGGGVASFTGLRPIYMCKTAWDQATQNYGDPTVPEITFYGDTLQVGTTTVSQASSCGSMGPGNWGLADLANGNGAPGVSTVEDWFAHGYSGNVLTGTNYESETGTPLHAFDSSLESLKTNQTVISIPLYDATSGNGSNAVFHVTQIASFVITGYQTTGTQSQRYIKGYFKKSICHSCSLGTSVQGGGTTKLRLVN